MPSRDMPRIGFIYPAKNPTGPENWSGTPRGLSDGLTRHGVEVVPIGVHLSVPLRYSVAALSRTGGRRGAAAHRAPVYIAARSAMMSRNVRRAGGLDAIIALGTDSYDLERVVGQRPWVTDRRTRIATYDDGTFLSFAKYEHSDLRQVGYGMPEINRWVDRQAKACRRADACCASTHWAMRSMIADYDIPESKAHVVGMGHRPRVSNPERDWSTPRFLFVGVDWQRKNGSAVVRAFQDLRKDLPSATLDLVGEHPRIDMPGVTGHGFLAREDSAAQAKLDGLYARSTAFVLPSLFDPSPIAYLEAASAGLPVIATTEGGAGELLGESALTVHPKDNNGLAAAMRRVADTATAMRMGQAAARRAADSSWESVAGRILAAMEVPPHSKAAVPILASS